MNLKKTIDQLRVNCSNYWTERLHSQLEFLWEMLQVDAAQSAQTLETVAETLLKVKLDTGVLTKENVLDAEQALMCYREAAKSYRLHLVSHAHIDMDWRWGYEETVGIVIDTFQTMLKLLEEYPSFVYSQSQASVYEIVEQYAPELLEPIRKYVHQGQWEVLASTWVEADKNMSGTEAMARHILYTKQYLSRLLGIEPDSMQVDFEPDTFGHSRHVPEILQQGGVRYYYHCRGNDQDVLYRWRAPSGAEVLTLRDPQWYYLKETDYHICRHVPSFCAQNHTRAALRFYGVGDHGGGPSRRDIERILDMQTWPLLPVMEFSTLHAFFQDAEAAWDQLPVVDQEQNFIFTGCYTAQSRIKQANRHGEDRLYDSETLCTMAQLAGCDLSQMPPVEPAWRNVLFNQFHDILPGTCVREAKERALGRFQDACALGLANAKRAMKELSRQVSTDAFVWEQDPASMAEGGGTGYGSWRGNAQRTVFSVNSSGNAGGSVRAYTLFNTTAYDREELVELTIWDWGEPLEATTICGEDGKPLVFDILEIDKTYWHHKYHVVSFLAKVPAFGYNSYYVMPADRPAERIPYFAGPRIHRMTDDPLVLENTLLRATFRRDTMELISLVEKASGQEQLDGPAAYFNLIDEQSVLPYSAWTVGRIGRVENLNECCFVTLLDEQKRELQQSVSYKMAFRSSTLKVQVSLAESSPLLRFSVEVDWHEMGKEGGNTPQLQFCVPYGYAAKAIRCDIPGGYLDRQELGHDIPAIRYVCPVPTERLSGIMLMSDCKYGYRAFEKKLCIDLLRSSINPDRYPEYGICQMELGLSITSDGDWYSMTAQAVKFTQPLYIYSNTIHSGKLPRTGSLLRIKGRANISALKQAEDGKGVILRMYQSDDASSDISVHLQGLAEAEVSDLLERKINTLSIEGDTVRIVLPANTIQTVRARK